MSAKILNITSRNRERMSQIATLDNFDYEEEGTVDAEQIIDNPNISLYCLDPNYQRVIFVDVSSDVDLAQAPFVYQAQFENATHLIAVSYATFHTLAEQLTVDSSCLICIHNIGRCGSTLLSQALNEVDSVISLSEADVFSNFVMIRNDDRDTTIKLLQNCFKFMFRPAVVGQANRYGLKFRNQCVDIMDLYNRAFPDAQHLFMYRNGRDWLASLYRLIVKGGNSKRQMTRAEAIELQANYISRPQVEIESFFPTSITTYSVITYLAVGWSIMMTRYIELYDAGFRPNSIRYEDLISHQDEMLANIIEVMGLPTTAIQQAQNAFARDSQAGTKLARDDAQSGNAIQLSSEDLNIVSQLLAQQPKINRSDVILPGTLQP